MGNAGFISSTVWKPFPPEKAVEEKLNTQGSGFRLSGKSPSPVAKRVEDLGLGLRD